MTCIAYCHGVLYTDSRTCFASEGEWVFGTGKKIYISNDQSVAVGTAGNKLPSVLMEKAISLFKEQRKQFSEGTVSKLKNDSLFDLVPLDHFIIMDAFGAYVYQDGYFLETDEVCAIGTGGIPFMGLYDYYGDAIKAMEAVNRHVATCGGPIQSFKQSDLKIITEKIECSLP